MAKDQSPRGPGKDTIFLTWERDRSSPDTYHHLIKDREKSGKYVVTKEDPRQAALITAYLGVAQFYEDDLEYISMIEKSETLFPEQIAFMDKAIAKDSINKQVWVQDIDGPQYRLSDGENPFNNPYPAKSVGMMLFPLHSMSGTGLDVEKVEKILADDVNEYNLFLQNKLYKWTVHLKGDDPDDDPLNGRYCIMDYDEALAEGRNEFEKMVANREAQPGQGF